MGTYHLIKFGCKKISRYARNGYIWSNQPSVWPLNSKTSNQSSCITLWPMKLHHHTKFGYRRFSSWGDIVQMNIHWNSEPFLWPWPWPQQSNSIISQDNPPYDDYHQTKFSCKRISNSDSILKSHILIILSLTVTLILKTVNQFFWKTIWLIMLHHHTKFVGKSFSVSADIIRTKIHWHFEPSLWPWS